MEKFKNFSSENIDKIRGYLTWDPIESPVRPWILVVGPPKTGKTTFIRSASGVLWGETNSLLQVASGQSNDLTVEKTVDDQTVSQVQKMLQPDIGTVTAEKQMTSGPPTFMVIVQRAHSGPSDQHLLNIKRSAADSGIPSCLILTYDDKTRYPDAPDMLGMTQNRVCPVDITGRRKDTKTRSNSQVPLEQLSQYSKVLEIIAHDFRQSLNNAQERAKKGGERSQPKGDVKHKDTRKHNGRKSFQQPPSDSCRMCNDCLLNNTDAHVFQHKHDVPVCGDDPGATASTIGKLPPVFIEEFHKIVCSLLNTLEGGTVCVHIPSRYHEKFDQQVGNKLTEMLPPGVRDDETYVRVAAEDHVFFSVKAAQKGGRQLCTYDFKVEVPRIVGLIQATPDQVRGLTRNLQTEPEQYTPTEDPDFVMGDVMPLSFTENTRRQMKACTRDDIVNYKGGGRLSKIKSDKNLTKTLVRYICAFVTNRRGGDIYLGFSQNKLPKKGAKPSGCPPVYRDEDLTSTGEFLCDGIQLTHDERDRFEKRLRKEVKRMHCCSSTEEKMKDITVLFPAVGGGSKDLCVVKISVPYFPGIIWPRRDGPLAYRVVCKGANSEYEVVPLEDWCYAFTH